MATSITYEGTLVVVKCWCGMAHAVPEDLADYQRRAHADGTAVPDIYCPLGHCHVPAGKGRAERERELREATEQALANSREETRIAYAEISTLRAAATKARKRAARGVCPCCHRSFVDVARHINGQHPTYVAES